MKEPENLEWKDTKQYTIDQVKKAVGAETITHMIVEGRIPSDLYELTPNLKHLRIDECENADQVMIR